MINIQNQIAKYQSLKWSKYMADKAEVTDWYLDELAKITEEEWKAFNELDEQVETAFSERRTSNPEILIDKFIEDSQAPQLLIDLIGFAWMHKYRNANFTQNSLLRVPIPIITALLDTEYHPSTIHMDENSWLILNQRMVANIFNNPTLVFSNPQTGYGFADLHKWIMAGLKLVGPSFIYKDVHQLSWNFVNQEIEKCSDELELIQAYLITKKIYENYANYKIEKLNYTFNENILNQLNETKENWKQLSISLYEKVTHIMDAEIPDDWLSLISSE